MNTGIKAPTFLKRFAVLTVATALISTLSIAVTPAAQAYEPSLRTVNGSAEYDAAKRVPAIESMADVQGLPVGESDTVILPGTENADSALIRISVFAPTQDITVTATGIPALFAEAGHDASTTVLVPVSKGTTTLASSATVDARVEVLATFVGDKAIPGTTNVVAQPESRPATTLDTGQSIGVIGLGGLPSEDVRATYVTADVDLPQAGTVAIAGQQMSLPQGRSVVSTIVIPDQTDGGIAVSSSVGGTMVLTARGWVADAGTNTAQANVTGSYVPTANPEWEEAQATVDEDGTANVPGLADRALSIALVNAVKTDHTGLRTFVDAGRHNKGRSEGVLVDDTAGALPQIEVIESPSDSTPVSVRGDGVDVHVLPLGDVLGAPTDDGGKVHVSITSPSNDDSINLAETGAITLTGTVSSDTAIKQIKVYGNSTEIGTADVIYTAKGTEWSMQVAAPSSEDVTYTVEAITRGGTTVKADVDVNVTLPSEDDIVVNPDTVVVSPDDATNPVLTVNSSSIVFANQPEIELGQVIVSGIGTNAPEGFIRRVAAIEHTETGWIVSTTPATLTDILLQATINQPQELSGDQTTVEDPDGTDTDDGIELVNGGADSVSIVPDDAEEPMTASPAPLARNAQRSGNSFSAKIECTAVILGNNADDSATGGKNIKLCTGTDESDEIAKRSKGVILTFEAALKELGVGFNLNIDMDWDWFLPNPTLKYFYVDVHGDYGGKINVKAFGKIDKSFNKEIARLRTTPVTIPIGPVPIVITTDTPISFAAKTDIAASIQYTYGWARHFAFGKEFKNGEWHDVKDNSSVSAPYDNVPCNIADGLDGSLTFKPQAGIKIVPSIKVYDIGGPKISAQLTVGFTEGTVTWNAAAGGTLNADLELIFAGDGKLTVEVPVIDWTLADVTIAEYNHEWELKKLDNIAIPGFCQPDDEGQSKPRHAITGTVTDAENGEPISGIDIQVVESPSGSIHLAHTDSDGAFSIELNEGSYTVKIDAEGYVSYEKAVNLSSDTSLSIALVHPTSSSDEYRAVLTWGERPRDEDSHLIGTDGVFSPYHVYYADKYAYRDGKKIAWLDVDDTSSYGPETITFDVSPHGVYSYYVHNYSGEADLSSSGAEVRLYRGDQLVKVYDIPTDWENQSIWQVFSIVNGEVVGYVDQPNASALTLGRMALPPKE